jgi:cytidylate kinase
MRPIGRLRPAADAVILHSDNLSLDEVLLEVLRIVHQRRGELTTAG